MIIVHARIEIKNGKIQEFAAALDKCVVNTRKEAGNHSYTPYTDLADPHKFIIVEEWESQASLDAHMQTPHFKQLIEELDNLAAAPADIKVFEATVK